LLLGFDLAH